MSFLYALVSLIGCLLVLLAEYRNYSWGKWLFKPLAAAAFVALALDRGAFDDGYGRLILLGLCLSWCGDVLLIPKSRSRWFLFGIGSFLLAHLAYAAAFIQKGVTWLPVIFAMPLLLGFGYAVLRWLWPQLRSFFRGAVAAYIVAILMMLLLALGCAVQTGGYLIFIGALGFALSDLAVARERFIASSIINRLWGLPLYFAAQCVLAYSVGGVKLM